MKILFACEYSGITRDAFIARGHDCISCDLRDTERPGPHYKGDVRDLLKDGWDAIIAFSPCTRKALSGVRWLHERNLWKDLEDECALFNEIGSANCPRIARELPAKIPNRTDTP